jgi:hypothetical protein
MRFLVVFLAAAAFAAPAGATLETVVLAPADDVSLPFLCSWGYDWQERCYRDDLDRLELGGAGDKVWRSALRFPLEALPPDATVVTAELWLTYDGTCTAPLRRTVPCDGRGFSLEAHPIYTADWYGRREVAFGPAVALAEIDPGAASELVVWDVTDTVADWYSGGLAKRRRAAEARRRAGGLRGGRPGAAELELHRPGAAPATGGVAHDLGG